ncbi:MULTISPECIES: NifB/NifX family molybdenum-iron cluster-binding protein [Thiorhodovibrio]|uniref:NifB/NifX family molybdenum-iron cluster-binding protein n=1 Tax=Thiorhodovibrio TaxID=61593 RepID=UPI0019146D27|nr:MULTISPECIES: NifB/NifX family molybdenum-iron cluster-binding protein [Thiorhodovibrio]MBK5970162.1 nitrogen fixation protein NifX [Thiorhodovibrio winogradskyi]WPL14006.1 nitrogen fixation protein NifX [Thiorhodovibrio litoralis]
MPVERRLKLLNCDTPPSLSATETAIKVAFATADLRRVDQHFGAAQSFALYAVDRHGCEMLEVVQFGQLDMDGNEDKLGAKIDALEGCVAVYCQAVGASAVSQLRARGVQPLKVEAGTLIKRLLAELQRDLADGPSAWLMRAIAARQPRSPEVEENKFDDMEAEGWSE